VKNGDYVQLKLPAIQVERVEHKFPASGEIWIREPGDILNPRYESEEVLRALQKLDPTNFAAQYQQEPIVQGNGTIEHDRIKRYWKVRDEYLKIVMSVDSASSVSERAAKWGISVWGLYYDGGKMHFDLLYAHAKKYEYPAGKKLVLDLGKRYSVTEYLIENKSTGTSLIPELKEKHLIVSQMTPTKDKVTRMMSVAHLLNLGYVHAPDIHKLPFTEGWLNAWLREIQGFPNSVDRDLVDSTSQILAKYGAVKLDLSAFYRLNKAEVV
jgi:predicted phage terminase large subunit-like protein